MKKILITGANGGMGLSTVKKFLDENYFVVGIDLTESNYKHHNFLSISCDITNKESIDKAFTIVKERCENLDTIINFAGVYDLNSLVEIKEEDFIKIFDINLFGLYRINKTFLPLLSKNSKIIITSSELAPLDPLPFTGLYGITKAAVEKYAYSLRMELQLLDIKVVVIRPGAVETKLLDASISSISKFTKITSLYNENANKFEKITNSVESKSIKPEKVASLVYKIDNKKNPRYLYNINRNFMLRFLNILPQRLQNKIIKLILK